MNDRVICGGTSWGNGLVLVKLGYQHFMVPQSVARELAEAAMNGLLRNANQDYTGKGYVYSEGERVDFEVPAKELESDGQRASRKQTEELERLRKKVAELESERQEPTPNAVPSQDFPL